MLWHFTKLQYQSFIVTFMYLKFMIYMIVVTIDYGYCNYLKKSQYYKYIVHKLKDIATPRSQYRTIPLICIVEYSI